MFGLRCEKLCACHWQHIIAFVSSTFGTILPVESSVGECPIYPDSSHRILAVSNRVRAASYPSILCRSNELFHGRFFNDSVNLNLATGSSLKDGTLAMTSTCLSTRSSEAAASATSSLISFPWSQIKSTSP